MYTKKNNKVSLKSMTNEELDKKGKRMFNDDDFSVFNNPDNNNNSDSDLNEETTLGDHDMAKKMLKISAFKRGQLSFDIDELKDRIDDVPREDGMDWKNDEERELAGYGKKWQNETFLRQKIMESHPNYQLLKAVSGHLSAPVDVLFVPDDLDDRVRREILIRRHQENKLQENRMTLQQLRDEKGIYERQINNKKKKRIRLNSEMTELDSLKSFLISSLNSYYDSVYADLVIASYLVILNTYSKDVIIYNIGNVASEIVIPHFINEDESNNNNNDGIDNNNNMGAIWHMKSVIEYFMEIDKNREEGIGSDDIDLTKITYEEPIKDDFFKRFIEMKFDESILKFAMDLFIFIDSYKHYFKNTGFTNFLGNDQTNENKSKGWICLNVTIYFNFLLYKIIDRIIYNYNVSGDSVSSDDYKREFYNQKNHSFDFFTIEGARKVRVEIAKEISKWIGSDEQKKERKEEIENRKKHVLCQFPRFIFFSCEDHILLEVFQPPFTFAVLDPDQQNFANARYKFIKKQLENKNEAKIARNYLEIDSEKLIELNKIIVSERRTLDIRSEILYSNIYNNIPNSKKVSQILEDIYNHFNGVKITPDDYGNESPKLMDIFKTSKLSSILKDGGLTREDEQLIDRITNTDISSKHSVFPRLIHLLIYWNKEKILRIQDDIKKLTKNVEGIDEKLSKFGKVNFDEIGEVKYPYKHRPAYALSPENSGRVNVIPAFGQGLEKALNLIKLHVHNLKNIPEDIIQDNPNIRSDFAELVELCMDKKSLIHPKYIRGHDDRKEIALQQKDVIDRLRRYKTRKIMGPDGYTYDFFLNGGSNYRSVNELINSSSKPTYKTRKQESDDETYGRIFM